MNRLQVLTLLQYLIIITDHNVKDTFDITDKVYILHKGEILSSGIPSDVVKEEQTRNLFLGYDFEWTKPEENGINP
jgi:ABC-type lipopolysaccharide export system ATPase subunit